MPKKNLSKSTTSKKTTTKKTLTKKTDKKPKTTAKKKNAKKTNKKVVKPKVTAKKTPTKKTDKKVVKQKVVKEQPTITNQESREQHLLLNDYQKIYTHENKCDEKPMLYQKHKKRFILNKRTRKHNQSEKNNPVMIVSSLVALIVALITIAHSSFQEAGIVSDVGATVRVEQIIRVTGVTVSAPISDAISNYEDYNVDSISSGLNLPNANSKITYIVDITNFGNAEMIISDITGLPEQLKYTLNDENYKLNEIICDDTVTSKCTLGATKRIYITISYAENGYDGETTVFPFSLVFAFESTDKVAQVGNMYFDTLQQAINSITTNTPTTIRLLKSTSENVKIGYPNPQTITLDIRNNTISNNGNDNVIKNYGTLYIINGRITSSAATNGAINNYENATIYISGGRVEMTGGRQALYNDKGTAYISENAYLSATTSERAAVQQTSGSTMRITGGTIISSGSYALNNAGTLTIGTEGGEMSTTSPLFKSDATGVAGINSTTNYSFFDGVVKSKGTPFNDVAKITTMESGYGIVTSTETINGVVYNVVYLGISAKVTFNANGGSVSETTRYVEVGHTIGSLPVPIRSGYDFDGWFTAKTGGTQVNASTVVNDDLPLYAHWTQTTDVAQIGQTLYATLQAAINAVPKDNTQTTITVVKDVAEELTVYSDQNIILDLGGKTINNSGAKPVIVNSGDLTITNGSIVTDANQGAINHTAGSLTIDGVEIIATGNRQAIYITGGTAEITGDSYLSSKTSGKPTGSNMERGTVQVVSGSLIITSGTIIGTNQQAVSNEGTVTIGTDDGSVDTTAPVLMGAVYGIKSTGTLNFYDGIIKGRTSAINGTVTDMDSNSTVQNGTETISGKAYQTAYLG